MGDILFLGHRVPFPPDRGDKIRSHHLLKGLARIAPVHVGTFAETPADRMRKGELAALAKTHALIDRQKPLPLAGLQAVVTNRPVSLAAFDHAAMRSYVAKTVRNHRIDTIFVFSGQMGQYIPSDFGGRIIVDLCDVDSAKFAAYADSGQRRWLNRREARLLAREEQRLAHRADMTFLISDAEVGLFRQQIGDTAGIDVRSLGNGIDAAFFAPDGITPSEHLAEAEDPQLVFTGQMDYPPNIAAVEWMIDEVMPRLRQHHPRARFHVVGRAAPARLTARHGEVGTRVWGEVPDVRPFLRAADIVVAPLLLARGVQNKVLEAMAMARPVLLTPGAATGIDAQNAQHFLVREANPAIWIEAIDELFGQPARAAAMGAEARRYVVGNLSWESVYRQLAALVSPGAAGRDAA
ncbi:TIGR03087 family PEP-CTERM/XrtA system glycosyltransferase [Qipengyuania sp. XHP0207]|uniref:TIGR03087 family PEP-CTERM/XrtA system glycosyltransferase n=1 Tax=Qipengyuania sp. XHP0207 TaxID=3038078 RepID=UPI00241C423C|nr:TIGR03087 family PEP-CTERM/XrtA system glycosyltransferase [Qipengyuania sp. XHP0207]MDG5747458.1 TIGR03087 family PEP-CTERM/XrtA system glycosyltransferase [Qipengyuania sp. XHP0207]